ncbi:MAG: hypothetical protein IPH75_14435 [bacterium]|nr:hypothetical protein [bacterium]
MRAFSILLFMFALLMVCACQPSLLPFFSTLDEVGIPSMVGSWVEVGDDAPPTVWSIVGDSNGYQVTAIEDSTQKEYEIHAFKLGDLYFLDIVQEMTWSQDALNGDLFLQQHLVARVIPFADSMQIGILNSEWCAEMIDEEEIRVPFVVMESGYLLTASAEQIRPMLIKYGDDPDAFPLVTMYRQP